PQRTCPGPLYFGPLALQHRFRPAVADLLLPVRADRVPAVVPHHGSRAETERPPPLLQPPAHVDVVAGHSELRIEATDRLEASSAERHVAAGGVLGVAVGEEDRHGHARRPRDAGGEQSVRRRGEGWAALVAA